MATSRFAIPVAVVALAIPIVIVVPTGGTRTPVTFVVAVLLAALLLYVALSFGLQLAGFDGGAAEIADRLAVDEQQRRLLTRWLERARWARFLGGFAGVMLWIFGSQARGDLLVLGAGGIAVGAVIAELHHIRRPKGARVARLDIRTIEQYSMPYDTRRMIGVAIVAAVGIALGIASSECRPAIWWSTAALVVLGGSRWAQQRVAARPRPAVSESLTRADDLVRELAIGRGLARPATYLALALVAAAADDLVPLIGDAGELLAFGARLYAGVLWWKNRRLGLDFVVREATGPVLA